MYQREIGYDTLVAIVDFMIESGVDIDHNCIREDYSGRGMVGAECVGFVLESADQAVILGAGIADVMELDGIPFIKNARQDSMGRGIIIYFPSYALNSN